MERMQVGQMKVNVISKVKGLSESAPCTVTRVSLVTHKSTRAFADITFHGMQVNGFKVVQGNKGLFVSNPSLPNKAGIFYDQVYIPDRKLHDEVAAVILKSYADALQAVASQPAQTATPSA